MTLYTRETLRLAAETARTPRLHSPDATVERRSPTCGSRIVVDVTVDSNGRVTAYGHDARACALGQAAAALLAHHVVGRGLTDLDLASRQMAEWLSGACDDLPDWPGVEALAAARAYPGRHASLRLPFEAAAAAVAQATQARAA